MEDKIALIDMDGTVADYDGEMSRQLALLSAPGDLPPVRDKEPPHILARQKLIKTQPGFWRNLPCLEKGFEVVNILREMSYELHVLTKGPAKTTSAWTEKVEWCREHLYDAMVTITEQKSLVYGRVLVDDFPPYFNSWLAVRPRGIVVCVAQPWNEDFAPGGLFENPQVFRYHGYNDIEKLREILKRAYDR